MGYNIVMKSERNKHCLRFKKAYVMLIKDKQEAKT